MGFFFFSSRRRHTRWTGDWSSDVCSSDLAVLICGSGVGASVAANKFRGIRAGLCHDTYSAHQGVEHDHMNVLVLGGRVIGEELAHELVGAFVGAKLSQEERHLRRLAKIDAIEERGGLEFLHEGTTPC